MPSKNAQLNFRLSAEGKALILRLTDYHGLSQAAVVEMLLRAHARNEGLAPTTKRQARHLKPKQVPCHQQKNSSTAV